MVGWLVLADEILFWIAIVAGMVMRYLLHKERASLWIFGCMPALEVVVLVVAAIDLRLGATPRWTHGLAAVYIGWSVAFGPSTIRWVDARIAYRFAGGPAPPKPPASPSWSRAVHEWRSWLKMLLAAAIACVLLLAAVAYVGDLDVTGQLWGWMARMGLVTGVWLVGWPVWESVRALTGECASTGEPKRGQGPR